MARGAQPCPQGAGDTPTPLGLGFTPSLSQARRIQDEAFLMGLGLEMAQTLGLIHLSWEIRVVLGSLKDGWMQRETSASVHGSQPPEGLPKTICRFCSHFFPFQPVLVLLNLTKPAQERCHVPDITLSSPSPKGTHQTEVPVTRLRYTTSRHKLQ